MMKRIVLIGFTLALGAASTLAFTAAAPTEAEKTYVGCLAKSTSGAYSLTHILGASGAASELQLESSRVDLSKHVGQRVSVRGTDASGGRALTVSFVKTLTKSCS